MKILITGTAGFIGFHTAFRLLKDGHTVVGLDNLNDYYDPRLKIRRNAILKEFPKYKFYKVDIGEPKKVNQIFNNERPERVIHLAAQAGVRYSLINPWVYARSNYIGTLSIFEAAREYGVKKVLYASSSSVYGNNTKTPFSETDRTDTPLSLYAATKKANELLAHSYSHLFDIEMIGLRFFTVYGPWGRPDMAMFNFTKNIIAGKQITLFNNGNMSRSFTYINDIVEPIVRLLKMKPMTRFQIFNLGGGAPTSVNNLVSIIEKNIGKKAKIKNAKMHIADVPETSSDIKKIKKVTDFSPRVPIKEGVEAFIGWYLENEKWLSKLDKAKQ